MVIVLPTASSDTPHDNHPIDAQEHHSSGKRCTVQERTPPTVVSAHRREGLGWQHGKSMRARPPEGPTPDTTSSTHMPMQSTAGAEHRKDAMGANGERPRTTQRIIWIRGTSGMSVARSTMSSHSVRRHRAQCAASNQDRPTPIATVNGTARSMAPPIASVTTSRTRCSSPAATSRTSSSWICSSTRERIPCSASP